MTNSEILFDIQQNLKAPKNQNNAYGGYKYRNAEGIIENVKPLLSKHKLSLTFFPEIVDVCDRVYIKMNVYLVNKDGESVAQTCAYAREAEQQAGMASGQLTGATESYAKKYALCNLFAIDGEKDLDEKSAEGPAKEDKGATPAPQQNTPAKPQGEDSLKVGLAEMDKCTTVAELAECWKKHVSLQSNPLFIAKKEDRKQELSNKK